MHCKKDAESKSTSGAEQVLQELAKQQSSLTGQMDLFALKLLARPLPIQNGGSDGHSEDELDCKSPASETSNLVPSSTSPPPASITSTVPPHPPLSGRFSDSLLMAYVNSFLLQKTTDSVDGIEGKLQNAAARVVRISRPSLTQWFSSFERFFHLSLIPLARCNLR